MPAGTCTEEGARRRRSPAGAAALALASLVAGCDAIIDVDATYVEVACVPGTERPCYTGPPGTEGVGACRSGVAACLSDGSGYGQCLHEVLPACEDCATPEDESCDGRAACEGDLLWSRTLGIPGVRYPWSLEIDAAGSIVLAGTFFGELDLGSPPLQSAGDCDLFLAKLDAAGNPSWSRRFGDAQNNCGAVRVDVGPAGDILLSGSFLGTVDLGGEPLVSTGVGDGFVASFDAAGQHRWSRLVGDTTDPKSLQDVRAVFASPEGDVALVGTFGGTVDLGGGPLTSTGGQDVLFAGLGPTGDHLFSRRFGSQGGAKPHDLALQIVTGEAGESVIGIHSPGNIDVGAGLLPAEGTVNAVLASFDAEGEPLWSEVFGGADAALGPAALARAPSGDLVVHGPLSGAVDLGGGPRAANQGVFFARLDPAGGHLASVAVDGLSPYAADKPIEGDGLSVDCADSVVARLSVLGATTFGGAVLEDPRALVKLDASLQPIWTKGFASPARVLLEGMATDPRGNIVVAGVFLDSVTFDGVTLERDPGGEGDTLFIAAFAP